MPTPASRSNRTSTRPGTEPGTEAVSDEVMAPEVPEAALAPAEVVDNVAEARL